MQRDRRVRRFVSQLVDSPVPHGFTNPYGSREAAHNLLVFLSERSHSESTVLLVGEAPGFRGAALSGVPFASIATLTDDWDDPWRRFGPESNFLAPSCAPYRKEATATMVWTTLAQLFPFLSLPLTWNAVPFHPHIPDHLSSNMPLRTRSLDLGRKWLEQLLDLFPSVRPIAVGVSACRALTHVGIVHDNVRHPSHGGRRDFVVGLQRIREQLLQND